MDFWRINPDEPNPFSIGEEKRNRRQQLFNPGGLEISGLRR